MDGASSSSAEATLPGLDVLLDDLTISRTILASLEEGPQDSDTPRQISEARKEVARLQKAINKARGNTQGPATRLSPPSTRPFSDPEAGSKKAAKSSAAMPWYQQDDYAGPSSYSNSGNLTPASASGSAFGHKKRTFGAHLDYDAFSSSRVKSRRTTPSPQHTEITTPSVGGDFWADDASVIDLTGDNVDVERLFKQQMAALAQVEQARADEMLARALQQNLQNDSFPNSSAASPAPNGPTAFDRILGRPPQSSQVQGPPQTSQDRDPFGRNNAYQAGPSQPSSRMPGSFDFEDDQDDCFEPPAHSVPSQFTGAYGAPVFGSSNAFMPTMGQPSTGLPTMGVFPFSNPLPGITYVPDNLATGFDWRQQGLLPSGGYGTTTNDFGLSGSSSANGSTGYTGDVPPMASLGNHPGTLNSGAHAPSQTWGTNSNPHPAAGPSSEVDTDFLSDMIDLTNDIDWLNGLDALGNPLSDNLKSYYEDLHDDPRKTAEEIKDLLANIRPDEDIPEEDRIGTPEQLRYALYAHQQLALQWMMDSEKGKNQGGILADDMGLGKTISALALMVSRPSSDRIKTNLIVGPVALLKQWEIEIKKKLKPNHRLSVLLLHNKTMKYEDIRNYDVVLTSYGKVGAEQKRFEKWMVQHPGARPERDAELAKSCPLLHPNSRFYRVILDEAQCIKNDKTLQARGSCSLRSTYRWCLTGTPMMNGIHELYSLIKFLKIRPYHEQKEFNKTFGSLAPRISRGRSSGEYTKTKAMDALRVLLKAIMLRRMKTSTLDGKPLVILPPKTEEVVHVEFSDDERKFYTHLEMKTRVTFNKYLRAGTVGKNYSNILVLLLRLRQACCHPHLNLDVEYIGSSEITEQDMNALARTLNPDVVARLKAQNAEGFKCPICLDAVIDPTIVLPCGHNSCSECFTTLAERAVHNNIRAGEEGSAFRCPECRGPVDPKRVINLTSFKEVHMPEATATDEANIETASEASSTEGDESADSASESDSDDSDDSDEVDRNGNLKDFIVANDEEGEPAEDSSDDDDLSINRRAKDTSKTTSKKGKKPKCKGKSKSKGKSKETKEEVKPHMLKNLRTEARKNKSEHKRYTNYLRKNWMPSAKVSECCKILEDIRESGEKTIVFSQFTFLLDLLEIPIKYELDLRYCRYDGGMSRVNRDAAAQDFQDPNSRTKVMLVSLKAGNAGLNLTAANHVIIMDPFWNPYIEMQAVDRAYRIGQQKPVKVHRLLVRGTVEDRIADLQDLKRKFVDAALDEGESKNLGRLSTRDLQRLFNGD